MSLTPLINSSVDICKSLILRYYLIKITVSKPHLVCTFMDK